MAAPIVTCPNCGTRNRLPGSAEGVPRCGSCHAPLPWVVDVDAGGFEAAIRASIPVLVDFWAPWCGPCKWISPLVEELARTHPGQLKVVRLDIDQAPDIAARYEIQGIPTLVVIRGGREVDRLAGAAPKPQLEGWLQRHLGAAAAAGS